MPVRNLAKYREKRNFSETPEPAGGTRRSAQRKPVFIIQEHDATNLHYDFRLQIERVLVSWAVPKGPSLNPKDKRLAVMTEDHPLEYAGFEGVIPPGHYGAGTVMVWDRGVCETSTEIPLDRQLANVEIKVTLHGQKMRGVFVLIHTCRRATKPADTKRWLLIKERDEFADSSWDIAKPELDRSVISGRTMAEIAAGRAGKKLTRKSAPSAA